MSVVLHVTGTPRPKQSVRWVDGRAISVAATRKLLKLWTATLKAEARRSALDRQLDGAIRVDIDFYFGTPKAERWGQPHTHKPDKDNLEKAVLDALKGIVFTDDSRVASGSTAKWWAERAGAVIVVSEAQKRQLDYDDDDLGAAKIDDHGA